jgi:hypothetical protein
MYILGPFSKAYGRRQFILLVVNYFTNWVETEALAEITTRKVISFL